MILTADLRTLTGTVPAGAELWVTAPSVRDPEGQTIRAGGLTKVPFSDDGFLRVELLSTDTPGTDPVSWQYMLQAKWRGGSLPEFAAELTEDADLSDVQPVDPADPVYIPVAVPMSRVSGLGGALAFKAEQADVAAALATKADDATTSTALGLRVLATTYTAGLAAKANTASPTFTGTVTLPALVVSGSTRTATAVRTASATLLVTDIDYQLCNAAAAPITVTLPSTAVAGYSFTIKKVDVSANAVTIAGTIDGVSGRTLTSQWSYIHVISTTTSGSWYVVGQG